MGSQPGRERVDTSLTSHVRQGVWWGLAAGLFQQFASIATTVVLVRLLLPSDFGVVVAANVVIAMIGLFTYLGIRLAIVRLPQLDDTALWTLFWLSTGLGLATAVLGLVSADLAAGILGQPEAAPFLRVLSALILVQTLSGVPRAVLQRHMRFRAVYTVEIAAAVAQASVAITAALAGLGPWSLVLGHGIQSAVLLGGYWGVWRRRPRLLFDLRRAREQFRFGAGMWSTSMLGYVVRNADFWAVSRTLGGSTLGVYYIAYVLPNILRQRLTWVTSEVMMPSFATMQENLPRLRAVYRRSLSLHASLGIPAMAGLAAVSPMVVEVFFGEPWAAAAAPMALICIATAVEFMTQPALSLLVALGRSGTLVVIQLGRVAILVPGCFLVVSHGLVAVAAVVLASSLLTAVHAQLACAHRIQGSVASFVGATVPGVVASAGMSGVVLAVRQLLPVDDGPLGSIAILVVVGVVTYPVLLFVLAPGFTRGLAKDLRLLTTRRSPRLTDEN